MRFYGRTNTFNKLEAKVSQRLKGLSQPGRSELSVSEVDRRIRAQQALQLMKIARAIGHDYEARNRMLNKSNSDQPDDLRFYIERARRPVKEQPPQPIELIECEDLYYACWGKLNGELEEVNIRLSNDFHRQHPVAFKRRDLIRNIDIPVTYIEYQATLLQMKELLKDENLILALNDAILDKQIIQLRNSCWRASHMSMSNGPRHGTQVPLFESEYNSALWKVTGLQLHICEMPSWMVFVHLDEKYRSLLPKEEEESIQRHREIAYLKLTENEGQNTRVSEACVRRSISGNNMSMDNVEKYLLSRRMRKNDGSGELEKKKLYHFYRRDSKAPNETQAKPEPSSQLILAKKGDDVSYPNLLGGKCDKELPLMLDMKEAILQVEKTLDEMNTPDSDRHNAFVSNDDQRYPIQSQLVHGREESARIVSNCSGEIPIFYDASAESKMPAPMPIVHKKKPSLFQSIVHRKSSMAREPFSTPSVGRETNSRSQTPLLQPNVYREASLGRQTPLLQPTVYRKPSVEKPALFQPTVYRDNSSKPETTLPQPIIFKDAIPRPDTPLLQPTVYREPNSKPRTSLSDAPVNNVSADNNAAASDSSGFSDLSPVIINRAQYKDYQRLKAIEESLIAGESQKLQNLEEKITRIERLLLSRESQGFNETEQRPNGHENIKECEEVSVQSVEDQQLHAYRESNRLEYENREQYEIMTAAKETLIRSCNDNATQNGGEDWKTLLLDKVFEASSSAESKHFDQLTRSFKFTNLFGFHGTNQARHPSPENGLNYGNPYLCE